MDSMERVKLIQDATIKLFDKIKELHAELSAIGHSSEEMAMILTAAAAKVSVSTMASTILCATPDDMGKVQSSLLESFIGELRESLRRGQQSEGAH